MFRMLSLTIALLSLMTGFVQAAETGKEVKPIEVWQGKPQDESLKKKYAPKHDFVADAKTWEKLWKAWRPEEEIPKIDFSESLVLVGTASGPNLAGMNPRIDDQGNVRFVVFSTKIGGPGFGYTLFQMNRDGVKSVNGEPVPPADNDSPEAMTEDVIKVTVFGTLRTGLAAIGGETTGTTITAKEITWELDLSESEQFAKLAEKLDGKRVVVEGTLERRTGIEVPERWIVKVSALQGLR